MKVRHINSNLGQFEDAIEAGPAAVRELEIKLGLIPESAREAIMMADLPKPSTSDEKKRKEKEAKDLVKKLNQDRRLREL